MTGGRDETAQAWIVPNKTEISLTNIYSIAYYVCGGWVDGRD